LEIIGDGPEHQRLLYTIQDLGLEGSVRLRGRLSPTGVRQRLQAADAFLLSSLSEGLSNAALEAMACGLPVVTTDCGGMREAITDGIEGLITPVRDAAALALALERLWQIPDLRQRMGEAGRRRILSDYTLKRQIDQFVDLFWIIRRSKRDG
jgi:glycosyltransferase involved in cell wall biosynthesis